MTALSGYISCILLRSIEKIEGQGSRGNPFSFEISYCCYRIVRTVKSIFIDDKWVSVPATPSWIPRIRSWISTKPDPQPRPQGAFPWGLGWNDTVKSFNSEWCWVLEQRIYPVDVLFLKNLFVKENLSSSILCAIIIKRDTTWPSNLGPSRGSFAVRFGYPYAVLYVSLLGEQRSLVFNEGLVGRKLEVCLCTAEK